MRILFDNRLKDAHLFSMNAEDAYPVRNLTSQFIRQIYRSAESDDTLSITFDEDQIIDSMFWGWTNAKELTIGLYDEDGLMIDVVYLQGQNVGHYYGYGEDEVYGYDDERFYGYWDRRSNSVFDPAAYHWPKALEGVRSITIEMATDEGKLYMGGLAFGVSERFPNPNEDFTEGWVDNSIISRSQAGQVVRDYVEPLRQYRFGFSTMDRKEMNRLRGLYMKYGLGKKVWLDVTDKRHEFIPPMFGIIDEWTANQKRGNLYSYNMTITEAR